MNRFWINVYSDSAGLTDYYLDIHCNGREARLTICENSIGDEEPWMESEEIMNIDEALEYVWPDEEAVAKILELSGEDHTNTLKKLGYKGVISMKKCPQCGIQVETYFQFCNNCGADLRVPKCIGCQKELPEGAMFCPWCGTNQKEAAPQAPVQSVYRPAAMDRPRAKQGRKEDLLEDMEMLTREKAAFRSQQQEFLKELIRRYYGEASEKFDIFAMERSVGLEDSYDAWSNDDSWTEYTRFTAKPIRWTGGKLKCLQPGLVAGEFSDFLKEIAEHSGGEIWSASMPYYNRDVEKGFESVDYHDLLLVKDPCGIGVDVLFEYQCYNDRYAY